jgi:hypothetical protein
MGTGRRVLAALLACFVATGPGRAEADGPSEKDAVALLEKATEAARAATRGDKAAVKALAGALEAAAVHAGPLLKSTADGLSVPRRQEPFAAAWNEAVTVMRFHGGAPARAYVLSPVHSFSSGGIRLGLPVSARWSYAYTGEDDQHLLSITQKGASGETLCLVKLWVYRWNVVYSGIGGENYVGLAKVMHELDRDATLAKGRKVSPRVTTVRLNAHFPRAQYYHVEGFDMDEVRTVRRRNYYLKDRSRTYCVELIEYRDPAPKDDAVDAWQRDGDACPERRAFLESIAPRD